jgi:hypothetical protein
VRSLHHFAASAVTALVVSFTARAALAFGGITMPSLQDEKDTYALWGWTWAPALDPVNVTEPIGSYSVVDPDVHYDTEADDLWTYLMMYERTGNEVYYDRAGAWARYFKDDYTQCDGGDYTDYCFDRDAYGLDHAYGWGLLAWHNSEADAAALAAVERVAADLEAQWQPGSNYGCYDLGGCLWHGLRAVSRHLFILIRLVEVTGSPRWTALRDKILDKLIDSTQWNEEYGMYFSDSAPDNPSVSGPGSYAAGLRCQSSFQIGLLAEALDYAYRATQRPVLRERLVAMARWVASYALDPTYQYASSWIGMNIVTDTAWQSYNKTGNETVTVWDPSYTTSLVNTLVYGYKYTGDAQLLARAKFFFNRGMKADFDYWDPNERSAADDAVHHFVDTEFDSSSGRFFLAHNKGELQYTYRIFENGGLPAVLVDGPPPAAPTNLQVQ